MPNRSVKDQIKFLEICIKYSEKNIISKDDYLSVLFFNQTQRLKQELEDLKRQTKGKKK